MPKPPTPPKSRPFLPMWSALVLLVVWSLVGCATPPAPMPSAPVRSVQIPPLPSYARQPPAPSTCLPTCSAELNSERQSWLELLTTEASPDVPASANTKKPAPR